MRSIHARPEVLLATAAVLLLAGLAVGRSSADAVTEHRGSPHSVESRIGVHTDGWDYAIPLDIPWRDASGSWHDGGRPACLPPTEAPLPPVTFGAVDHPGADGPGSRPVVWVRC